MKRKPMKKQEQAPIDDHRPNEDMLKLIALAALGAQLDEKQPWVRSYDDFVDLVVRAHRGGIDNYYAMDALEAASKITGKKLPFRKDLKD